MINFSLSQSLKINSQIAEFRRSLNQAQFHISEYLKIEYAGMSGLSWASDKLIADYCDECSEHEDLNPARFADPILLAALCAQRPIFISPALHFDRPMLASDCANLNLSDRIDDLALYCRILSKDRSGYSAQFPIALKWIQSELSGAIDSRDRYRSGESWADLIPEFEHDRGLFPDLCGSDNWDRGGLIAAALSAIDSGNCAAIRSSLDSLYRAQLEFRSKSDDLIGRIHDLAMGISAGYRAQS